MGATDDYVEEKEAPIKALDETDIAFLKNYGLGPYAAPIKRVEDDIKSILKKVNEVSGIKESDTGLAPPSRWDLVSDKQMMQEEQPLQVARCTKIINPNTDEAKYVINVKQIAKFVVGLGDKVAPTDIEEGMRVGVDRNKYQIQIPLPPKIDPSVTMMTVEEKPDVTYSDIGGSKEQIEKMREVVELPLLHPEKFVQLGIDPPKGVLCYGPPGGLHGSGSLMCAAALHQCVSGVFLCASHACAPGLALNQSCSTHCIPSVACQVRPAAVDGVGQVSQADGGALAVASGSISRGGTWQRLLGTISIKNGEGVLGEC